MKFINQYNVELTDECKKDIRNIYTYIRNNLDAEDAANTRRTYRRIVVNNYIILFTIDEKDKKVYVSHIYYKGRDYLKEI